MLKKRLNWYFCLYSREVFKLQISSKLTSKTLDPSKALDPSKTTLQKPMLRMKKVVKK